MVNNRSSVDPRMLRAVKVPLRGMETATISLIAPNSVDLDDTDWTPWLNNLSNTSSVYWSGKAQVAVFRQTLNTFMPVGSITQFVLCVSLWLTMGSRTLYARVIVSL